MYKFGNLFPIVKTRIKLFTLLTSALIFSLIRPHIGMVLMIGLVSCIFK